MTQTRTLLALGVVAGPVYVATWLIQAVTRDGFSLLRHPASILANGDLGWIQITNLILTGAMVVAAAVGMRRVLRSGRGATWGPRLLAGFGAGMILAGVFRADPVDGFPVGTPEGPPTEVSWHGILHFGFAGLGFLCLVVACILVGRWFGAAGERGWARVSVATGVFYLVAWLGMVAGQTAVLVVAMSVAIIVAWAWLSAVSVHLTRKAAAR